MMRAILSWSDLGPRRLGVRRMSLSCLLWQAVPWPTVQQHYTGSTSTPPGVARLWKREASLVALRKIHKTYACSHVSIIGLVQSTMASACNSSLSLFSIVPVTKWTRLREICHHTKHRSQSVESFTSQRFRQDVTRVHSSLGWLHRQQFPEYQISNE